MNIAGRRDKNVTSSSCQTIGNLSILMVPMLWHVLVAEIWWWRLTIGHSCTHSDHYVPSLLGNEASVMAFLDRAHHIYSDGDHFQIWLTPNSWRGRDLSV